MLLKASIEVNNEDLNRIVSAFKRLEVRSPEIVADKMQRRCATDYFQKIFKNIVSGKYSGGYRSYSKRYAKWKSDLNLGLEFWVLQGDLLNALTAFQEDGGWVGGIPAGVMDSGGKSWLGRLDKGDRKDIAWYARLMEFGSSDGKQPARPLFEPTAIEYSQTEWPKRGEEALREVGDLWR